MNIQERDLKIQEWFKISSELELLKNYEMQLRREIAAYVIGAELDTLSENRTSTLKLGQGYGIKAETTLNYKLDETERVEAAIEEFRKLGELKTAKRLFTWKPTLSESCYKNLAPYLKAIVDEVLNIKPGAPKLEFIAPKVQW